MNAESMTHATGSGVPATLMQAEAGTLAAGQRGDFVWLDAGLNAVQTWIGGRPVCARHIAA